MQEKFGQFFSLPFLVCRFRFYRYIFYGSIWLPMVCRVLPSQQSMRRKELWSALPDLPMKAYFPMAWVFKFCGLVFSWELFALLRRRSPSIIICIGKRWFLPYCVSASW